MAARCPRETGDDPRDRRPRAIARAAPPRAGPEEAGQEGDGTPARPGPPGSSAAPASSTGCAPATTPRPAVNRRWWRSSVPRGSARPRSSSGSWRGWVRSGCCGRAATRPAALLSYGAVAQLRRSAGPAGRDLSAAAADEPVAVGLRLLDVLGELQEAGPGRGRARRRRVGRPAVGDRHRLRAAPAGRRPGARWSSPSATSRGWPTACTGWGCARGSGGREPRARIRARAVAGALRATPVRSPGPGRSGSRGRAPQKTTSASSTAKPCVLRRGQAWARHRRRSRCPRWDPTRRHTT